MEDSRSQSAPPVSRAGRILKKSAKQIEAEESYLTEALEMQISRRKTKSFEDTVHCLGVVDNSSIKGTKVFDFKLRPGSTRSIALSDENATSEPFKKNIKGFQVMDNDFKEENKVLYSKHRPCSTLTTSSLTDTDETSDSNNIEARNSSLKEENEIFYSKRHYGSTHSTYVPSNDANETSESFNRPFRHFNMIDNGLNEESRMFYSKHRFDSAHSTCLSSNDANETPKSFNKTFQHLNLRNNSLNEESKMFHSKHRSVSTHSIFYSSIDENETSKSFKNTVHQLVPMNNSFNEESKEFYSKCRPSPTHSTSLSSSDDDGTLETESENSNKKLSTSSSSEYLEEDEEDKKYDRGIIDHKYCTRFRRTRDSKSVATRKPQLDTFENVAFKRTKNVNAYTLWSSLNRRIISATYRNLQRQDISRKVVEEWNALPPEEKKFWARKAKELSERIQSHSFSSGSDAGMSVVSQLPEDSDCNVELKSNTQMSSCALSKNTRKKKYEEEHILGIAPVDTAAHLKLLGDSLMDIGQKIMQERIEPSATGAYCVLLDSLLCSMGALLCLTREIPGLEQLPGDSFAKTLDHIAYFMPCL